MQILSFYFAESGILRLEVTYFEQWKGIIMRTELSMAHPKMFAVISAL